MIREWETPMNDNELIHAIKQRAENARTRTDYADRACPELAPPAPPEVVSRSESALGFPLHPFHRRLLTEVANGGFGPGDGLIGLPGGRLDDAGRSIIELRSALWSGPKAAGLPAKVLALCDWGDAIWSCLDEETGNVLTLDESGLMDAERSLCSWFADWVTGVNLFGKMFTFEERTMTNPFTKQLMTVQTPTRALGTPYKSAR
jgi:hypothetical protein